MYFFFYLVSFHSHSRITGLQGKGEGISLTSHYHFHPLHRHLDISRTITAESSPLHIACSWTRTRNFWFPSRFSTYFAVIIRDLHCKKIFSHRRTIFTEDTKKIYKDCILLIIFPSKLEL